MIKRSLVIKQIVTGGGLLSAAFKGVDNNLEGIAYKPEKNI